MNDETRTTRTVALPGRGLDFEILARDSVIGPSIEGGGWEEHETALFQAHLRPGCTVVDLGGNVGWFAVQAILAGANVHSFEPVPEIADVCGRNIERANAVGPGHGVLHRAAAGAVRGTAEIALADENRGDNRVLDDGSGRPGDMGAGEVVTIDVVPVDELVEGPARVLKIDTQGSEWVALQGATKLLAASPELALLIEFWPYALRGAQPEELLAFLDAEGFTLGKATAAPYPMTPERILHQALARDPVKGGLDLYGTRALPFHVLGLAARLRAMARGAREE
jgi:FkbM family methyltransferase